MNTEHRRRDDRVTGRLRAPQAADCAVCGQELEPCLENERLDFAGLTRWFCCRTCRDEFDRQPLFWSEESR